MKEKIVEILVGLEVKTGARNYGDTKTAGRLRENCASHILELFEEETNKYKDALIWCSGSEDFQVGGKARIGWEKICIPLLKE